MKGKKPPNNKNNPEMADVQKSDLKFKMLFPKESRSNSNFHYIGKKESELTVFLNLIQLTM